MKLDKSTFRLSVQDDAETGADKRDLTTRHIMQDQETWRFSSEGGLWNNYKR